MNNKRLQHEQNYVKFLETRLRSKNFKENSTKDEVEKTEKKLKKAKLVLRMLQ